MTEVKTQTAQKNAEKERRLAAALKRNMLRRKAQRSQREEKNTEHEHTYSEKEEK